MCFSGSAGNRVTSPIGLQRNLEKVSRIAVFIVLIVSSTNGEWLIVQIHSDTLVKKVGQLDHYTFIMSMVSHETMWTMKKPNKMQPIDWLHHILHKLQARKIGNKNFSCFWFPGPMRKYTCNFFYWSIGQNTNDVFVDAAAAGPVKPCASMPCKNGGTCIEQGQGYQCQCAEGFTGDQCESEKGNNLADIKSFVT